MKITALGTGTSQGVPVIGCQCEVCLSSDPKDKRLRSSVLIEIESTTILIDAGPDLRQQLLREDINKLDAVVLTHEHNDHMIGLDDLRPLIFRSVKKEMSIYAQQRVLDEIKLRFAYAFKEHPYPGVPKLKTLAIEDFEQFKIGDIELEALPCMHGHLPIHGFRINDFAYLTDVSEIPQGTLERLTGLKVLMLDCLRREKHYSHLCLEEANEKAQKIGAEECYFVHMSHLLGKHADLLQELPPSIEPSYDGMVLNL